MTSRKILVQTTKWSTSPKIPNFQNGVKSPWCLISYVGQNSNAYNIYRCKGNFIRINTVFRTRVQKWTNFKLLMGSRRDMFLKVGAFLLKIVTIWKNDLKQNRSNCLTKTFAIIYFQYNVYYSCSIMFNFMG